MNQCVPHHLSYDFKINLDKIPAKKSDRLAFRIVFPGMFLGFALAFLGIFELIIRYSQNSLQTKNFLPFGDTTNVNSFINPSAFDAILIILGIGIVFNLFSSYIRYKKIIISDKKVEIITRPTWGRKKSISEPLKNYNGVLMRIEFFQFGFMAKNKYIVELNHKDCKKTVPLYISTNDKNIRHIWKNYAKKLNMPAIMMSEKGLRTIEVDDLDSSIIELYKSKKLKNNFDDRKPLPASVAYARKLDKTVIKSRRVVWDIYNMIAWILIVTVTFWLSIAVYSYDILKNTIQPNALIGGYVLVALLLILSIFALFRKDKIAIKKYKLVIVHKFMLFSRKSDEIFKEEIEAIDIAVNPLTERHFLAISSDAKTVVFGRKLSIADLEWVRDFLINEIIKSKR